MQARAIDELMSKPRSYEYHRGGLEAEAPVKKALAALGPVRDSSKRENIDQDIDCWVTIGGEEFPFSIKAEHRGLYFGDIYFELYTDHYQNATWDQTNGFLKDKIAEDCPDYLSKNPGWMLFGKAKYLAILQKDVLRVYEHSAIMALDPSLFRLNGLDPRTLRKQNGKNTICAYISKDLVPFVYEVQLNESHYA